MSSHVWIISDLQNIDCDNNLVELTLPSIDGNDCDDDCYLFDSIRCQFYEITKQTHKFGSFFIDNTVNEGNLYIVTPVDLTFIVLPHFIKKRSKFCSLHDILNDGFDKHMSRQDINGVISALNLVILSSIADTKHIDGEIYAKYNEEKCLKWLECKINNVIEALKTQKIDVCSTGSKAHGYTDGKEESMADNDEYRKIAFDLIAGYLSRQMYGILKKFLKIPEEIATNSDVHAKQTKRKSDAVHSKPLEDYSDALCSKKCDDSQNKRTKMTRTQKQLLKVDKTGMKSISSFFKPQTK